MKTKVVIYSNAELEYTESLCWYAMRSAKAAIDFDAEFDAAIRAILDDPQSFPFCDDRHQFYLLRSFPFQIVFRCLSEEINVVAVAHTSRKPNYWLDRLRTNKAEESISPLTCPQILRTSTTAKTRNR